MEENIKIGLGISNLPKPIYDWLASSRLTIQLGDLNRRLNITGPRKFIISRLIRNLVNTSLDPQDFVNKLADELDLSQSAAKALTKEIERIALHPIENELKNELGIDIALLHFEREPQELLPLSSLGVSESSSAKPAPIPAPAQVIPKPLPEETERHIEAPRPAPRLEAPAGAPAPFILHKEKDEVRPMVQPPRPTFSIKIPLKEKKYAPVVPQVRARVEMGEEESTKIQKQGSNGTEEIAASSQTPPRNDWNTSLPRPPMGALSAKGANSQSLIADSNKEVRIQLKPITTGEPKKPEPNPFVKKVVNYSEWYTPLE